MMHTVLVLVLSLAVLQTSSEDFTHNRFTENGKTFSQDGAHLAVLCTTPEIPATAPNDEQIAFWQETLMCSGYVEGVADILSDNAVCIPPQTSGKSLVAVFVNYSKKHEDQLHGPASRIVENALKTAYPCTARRP